MTRSILLLTILLSGCSALKTSRFEPVAATAPAFDEELVLDGILRREAGNWLGTPHLPGGMSEAGIDCSALVQRVYADALHVDLPRTTGEQIKTGSRVRKRDVQVGDLVFFEPDNKGRHTGILLSNGEFVHASTSRGVMYSRLDDPYWARYFRTARRVLEPEDWAAQVSLETPSGN